LAAVPFYRCLSVKRFFGLQRVSQLQQMQRRACFARNAEQVATQ